MSRMARYAEPLRIVLFGFSERNAAMLTQLFSGIRWKDYVLVASGPADLGIVELDTPSPERTWLDYRRQYPQTLSIVLSLQDQKRENTHFMRKPVDTAELRSTIDILRKRIDESKIRLSPASAGNARRESVSGSVTSTPMPASARVSTQHAADEMDCELEERFGGNAPDVDLTDPRVHPTVVYDPGQYFQGLLEQAINQARTSGIAQEISGNLPGRLRIVAGSELTIEHSLRVPFLRQMCLVGLQSIKTTIQPSYDPVVGGTHAKASEFLWQVALWTARGRLRKSIPIDVPVRLLRWPNFTRVAASPHAMQIAAILVRAPHSALELSARLRIPQRHLFSFLSAVETSGILELAPVAASGRAAWATRSRPLRALFNRIINVLSADADK